MHHVVRAGLCALVAACGLAAAPVAHAASDPPALPTQGLYEWCDPAASSDGCASRLQRIGTAGFRVVQNGSAFNHLSEDVIRAYAQSATAAGVRVIWPFNALRFQDSDPNGNDLLRTYPDLAARCSCSTNQGLLAYLVGILRSLPGTWGYYLADEPKSDAHAALANWVSRVKALDPDHPRLIMGCGMCNGGIDANVAWLADLDIALGTDGYPVFGGPSDPGGAYASIAPNVAGLDRVATGAGRSQVVALQAWRWGDSAYDSQALGLDPASTRFPTREEIEAQRNAAIENAHPDLILWFTLTQVIGWEPGQSGPGWSNPTDTEQRWANLLGGAFAPVPSPAGPAPTAAPVAIPTPTVGFNRAPLARLTLRQSSRSRRGTRFVADGSRSQAPGGRIVRYLWTLNGKRLSEGRSSRRVFWVRRGRIQLLTLTVTDDRGARSATRRRFRLRGVPRG